MIPDLFLCFEYIRNLPCIMMFNGHYRFTDCFDFHNLFTVFNH